MGIFNPSSSSGTTATGFSPFVVLAQTCNSTGLFLSFGNNAGYAVTYSSTTINSQTGFVASSETGFGTVANGASGVLKVAGSGCSTAGSRYSVGLSVSYTYTNALGSQTGAATGTVAGSAS